MTSRRRRFNIQGKKQKKDELAHYYDVEETFRTTNHGNFKTNRPSIPTARVPISFRNTVDTRQQKTRQNDRYTSLEVPETSVSNEKKIMNQTFMGKIPKATIPKWEDESEKIRSILNKTITGHGTRKKKGNKFMALV